MHISSLDVRFADARLRNGLRLRYATAGPTRAEPVLFLHGYTDSWFSFSPILSRLGADFRGLAPDQRGHGNSDRPPWGYSIAEFAADAVAFLDAVGVRCATIVGHSMGSAVAQRLAIEHPERVERLVLVGSYTTAKNEAVRALQSELANLDDPIAPEFIRSFQEGTAHRELSTAFLDRVVAESRKVPARVWRAALSGMLDSDATADLRKIRVPTLIMWGEHDAFFGRAEQEKLFASIDGAELLLLPDTGHAPHWEDPDRFVSELRTFVGSTPRPSF